jgi:hypothetical protein
MRDAGPAGQQASEKHSVDLAESRRRAPRNTLCLAPTAVGKEPAQEPATSSSGLHELGLMV